MLRSLLFLSLAMFLFGRPVLAQESDGGSVAKFNEGSKDPQGLRI